MAMSTSQHYELRRREKENQNMEKSKRRSGNRLSDEGVVALEETKTASPQKLKTLDTPESPWRWERQESEEDLAVGGLPRKKENVRKKKRNNAVNGLKPNPSIPDCRTEREMVTAIVDLAQYGENEVGRLSTHSKKRSFAQRLKSFGNKS